LETDAVPLAHFIGAVSPMIPAYAVLVGASFLLCRDDLAQETRAEFDGLSGEGCRLVEDIWAGGAANERLRADGVIAGRDQWRAWAQAAWRELTGREPDEGFDERFDRHPQDRCCELSFCEACNLMGREFGGPRGRRAGASASRRLRGEGAPRVRGLHGLVGVGKEPVPPVPDGSPPEGGRGEGAGSTGP
jgi:hypothetical protein